MKKILCTLVAVFAMAFFFHVADANAQGTFSLTSPQISADAVLSLDQVFNGFGCTGKNISPALNWRNPPKGTKSFALTMYDPDAPTGSGWWHWVVSDIPASTRSLALGASGTKMPKGAVESTTDFGKPGYGGACPPPGDKAHRYVITLYALSVPSLEVTPENLPAQVGFGRYGKVLGTAVLTGYFSR